MFIYRFGLLRFARLQGRFHIVAHGLTPQRLPAQTALLFVQSGGAAFGAERDTYASVLAAGRKNYLSGVRQRTVAISADAPLVRLFHHVDGRSTTTFRVVEGGGEEDDSPPKELFTLSESQLRELAAKGKLSRTVRESAASGGKTE